MTYVSKPCRFLFVDELPVLLGVPDVETVDVDADAELDVGDMEWLCCFANRGFWRSADEVGVVRLGCNAAVVCIDGVGGAIFLPEDPFGLDGRGGDDELLNQVSIIGYDPHALRYLHCALETRYGNSIIIFMDLVSNHMVTS